MGVRSRHWHVTILTLGGLASVMLFPTPALSGFGGGPIVGFTFFDGTEFEPAFADNAMESPSTGAVGVGGKAFYSFPFGMRLGAEGNYFNNTTVVATDLLDAAGKVRWVYGGALAEQAIPWGMLRIVPGMLTGYGISTVSVSATNKAEDTTTTTTTTDEEEDNTNAGIVQYNLWMLRPQLGVDYVLSNFFQVGVRLNYALFIAKSSRRTGDTINAGLPVQGLQLSFEVTVGLLGGK